MAKKVTFRKKLESPLATQEVNLLTIYSNDNVSQIFTSTCTYVQILYFRIRQTRLMRSNHLWLLGK